MKRLLIVLCLVLVASTSYAYDRSGYWTDSDYEREYNQRMQNERLDRIEDAIRQNSDHRTYRDQRY